MADRDHDGAERDAEDTDELLYTDLNDSSSASGLDCPLLKLDHCDLLLDALDAQLGQLQVKPQKYQEISRERDCNDAATFRWSQSLSKDTGFGSTSQTNDTPMSRLDLTHTPMMEQTSERSTASGEGPVTHEEPKQKLDRRTRDKEEVESQREQVIWRLERLLGDACSEGRMPGETHPASDSVCTEDFVRRFRDEMVELALPAINMQQLNNEEEAGRTEILDRDTCQSEQKGHRIVDVERRGTAQTEESYKVRETAHYCQRKELEKSLYDSCGENTSCSEEAGTGEKYSTPQGLADDRSICHRIEVITEHETLRHNNSRSSKARCLAGVPVWSFDTVSIDSDLDSVCTEQVRQHIHRRPGWRSLIQSVTGMDHNCTNHSDYDTPTQEESEPRSTLGQRNVQNRSPVRKAQRNKRETYRLVCSLDDNDKDTDEEMSRCSRRCRPERPSEKMQSDWVKMKERLSTLRQKCEKEEQTLQKKKTQLKDVELSLSELQQRRKHALQELEQLTEETAKMEKEKRTLEFVLRDSRPGKDSKSYQKNELQRQRESFILGDIAEDLTPLSPCKQTLKDGALMKRPSMVMSVLEKEEMERQLDNAKTELFAEQRRAREKLESMQEKLEETHEELQRVAEAESLLRNTCAHLEEKQRQKKDQIKAVEFKVGELQGELGECKIRVGTQEKMLAQKELQLLDLQEQRGALQAERDGLRGELQHLKTQHCNTLKETQEQTHRMMEAALKQQKKEMALAHEQLIQKVNKQAEEEKANALKQQARSLTQHFETLKSSIQLKEEEAKKLRDSLEQQKKEAKNREEKLHVETLEKVHKAINEERRKWGAEKMEAVQVHCGILEEQMQREKSKALALQHKVVELKTRVQELESESCAQQREQESLLAVICKSLKEEHQAELQKMQRQMAQESQRALLRLEQAVQLAEKEADRLRVMLRESERSHNQITAELEQQLRHWAQELGAECQHLHVLVEQSGAKQSSVQLPRSPTAAEALTNLRTLREQLKHLINHLQQELDSQKQATEQLRKDKERELSFQRQQLRMDRDQALDSLKERLIQEHIEELSSLNWPHMCDGGAEGRGAAASLRKQLKAKDLELRQVQRSMAQWKEQTAARLACKFEEELTAELERCKTKLLRGRKPSKTQAEDRQRKSVTPKGEMTHIAKEAQDSVCSPSLHVVDSAASHSPSDVASFKLLRYLQSRVKQLRVENQAYTCSPSLSNTIPTDLSGSYLATITQDQGAAGIQSHSSMMTVNQSS